MIDRIREIENSLGLYLFAKDPTGKYTYCNEKFAKGLGLESTSEVIGKKDVDLFSKEIAQAYCRGDSFVLNGGIFLNRQELHPEAHRFVCVSVSKRKLKSSFGACLGIVGTGIELSEAKPEYSNGTLILLQENGKFRFKLNGRWEHFTHREYEVLTHILSASTSKQIGSALGISHRTVEGYVEIVKSKLGCANQTEIRNKIVSIGLLPIGSSLCLNVQK